MIVRAGGGTHVLLASLAPWKNGKLHNIKMSKTWKGFFSPFFFFKASKCKLSPHMPDQRSGETVRPAATPDGDFTGPFSNSHLVPWQEGHTAYTLKCVSISERVGVCIRIPPLPPPQIQEWGWESLYLLSTHYRAGEGEPHFRPSCETGPPLNSQTQKKAGGNLLSHFPNIQTGRWGEWDSDPSLPPNQSWPLSLLPKYTLLTGQAAGHSPPASHCNAAKSSKRSGLWY